MCHPKPAALHSEHTACKRADWYHCLLAALSDEPTIQGLTGGVSLATLSFLKPESATDQDTITYRAQVGNAALTMKPQSAPSVTSLSSRIKRGATNVPALQIYDASVDPPTALGAPVALKITSGAGTTGSPYVATLGPFRQPSRITVAVQATGGAGSVTTTLSAQSAAVVVGE